MTAAASRLAHVRRIRTVTSLATICLIAAGSWAPSAQAAPTPTPAWHRQAGLQANAVAVDKNRNVYVVGSLKPGPRWTLMLRKYALDGSLIWARNWRPAKAGYVNGRDVALAPDGGVYVVGDVAIPGSEGSGWFIARYAPDGRRRWVHDEPGWESGKLADSYGSVAVAGDRLIVAGNRFGCCGNPFNHGYLRSYTTGGKPMWRIPFDAPGIDPKFYDGATGVAGDTSGMFFVTGWAATALQKGETDFVDEDVVIQAVASAGTVAWTRVLGDHGNRDVDRGTAIAVLGDRLQVTADVDQRGFVRSHAWLGAFTLDGSPIWSQGWGATKHGNQSTTAGVSIAPNGAVYVAGSRRDKSDGGWDIVVRRFGPGGALVWQSVLEQGIRTLLASDVGATPVKGAYVAGSDSDGGGHLWRYST